MDRTKELTKNTVIIFLGTVCTKLITFLLLPFYTGILNTEEYGIVDLINVLVSLLIPIVTFQIEQAVFRKLMECRNDANEKARIITSSFYSVIIQVVIFVLIFCVLSPLIKNDYKGFLVANLITSIFSSLFLQIARGFGDNKRYSIGSFLNATFTIVSNIIFLTFFNMKVKGMLMGIIIGHLVCTVYLLLSLRIYNYIQFKKFDISLLKQLWKYSVPLIPNSISWWIFSSSDRLIVSTFLDLSMNGILSAASKFSGVFMVLYSVVDRSWIESISLHINDEDIDDFFNKMFYEVMKLFTSIIFLAISFMPFIYPIMINKNYAYGYGLVPILLLASLFNVVQGLIAVVYAAKKDTKSIAKTSLAAALLNIMIHFALLKFFGLYAAALSTLGAFFIIALYRLRDVREKYISIRINKGFVLISIFIFLIEIVCYYINNVALNIVSIIISLVCALLLNKNILNYIINFFLKRGGEK